MDIFIQNIFIPNTNHSYFIFLSTPKILQILTVKL